MAIALTGKDGRSAEQVGTSPSIDYVLSFFLGVLYLFIH